MATALRLPSPGPASAGLLLVVLAILLARRAADRRSMLTKRIGNVVRVI
jgi:hypothetical protein